MGLFGGWSKPTEPTAAEASKPAEGTASSNPKGNDSVDVTGPPSSNPNTSHELTEEIKVEELGTVTDGPSKVDSASAHAPTPVARNTANDPVDASVLPSLDPPVVEPPLATVKEKITEKPKVVADEGPEVGIAKDNDIPANVGKSEVASTSVKTERPLLSPPGDQNPRRFSFRSLGFFYGRQTVSSPQEEKGEKAKEAAKRVAVPMTRSERRAMQSAVAVQTIIIGQVTVSPANGSIYAKPVTKPQLKKVKSQLMQPKSANQVIAQLRGLPMPDGPLVGKSEGGEATIVKTGGPIHAVCLDGTEEELEARHFSKLSNDVGLSEMSIPSVASASLNTLVSLFNDLHVVNFITNPDFGLGQPGDGEGILSGAVPTAETVMKGAMQITPQLLALGYATGKAVIPDHAGIYPPLDRMSILTYWWGLEITMPEPTMKYLGDAKSISNAVMNFLTALSLIDNGVREILPFIRYISQFMDFEWKAIKSQDKGKGVVCAATWIMPAAMVPRPWDFADPPAKDPSAGTPVDGEHTKQEAPVLLPKAPNGNSAAPVKPGTPPPRTGVDNSDMMTYTPPMLPSLVVTPATLPRSTKETPDPSNPP